MIIRTYKWQIIFILFAFVGVFAFQDFVSHENINLKDFNNCDIEVKNNLCLFNGDLVVNTPEIDSSLIALISFDKSRIMDESLSKATIYNKNIQESTALKGYGRSGRLSKKESYLQIHNMPKIEQEYSIQFSLFIHQIFKEDVTSFDDKKIRIFQKFHSDDKKNLKLTFGLDSRRLFLSLPVGTDAIFKTLESFSRIQLRKWVQITIVKSDDKIKLYINGSLEGYISPSDKFTYEVEQNPFISFGNQLAVDKPTDENFLDYLIDDIRVYNRILESHEIFAKSEQFLGGTSSDFYRFSCRNCARTQVACPQDYHICNSFEILSQGFQYARSMGWVDPISPFIWTSEGMINNKLDGQVGLGMCCKDIMYQG
ncbi:hypothetical protein ABPG74_008498 [Tetrahymena malaccensis]